MARDQPLRSRLDTRSVDLPLVDVLIPTTGSPVSLGATLAAVAGQRYPSFRVTAARPPLSPREEPQLAALAAILKAGGHAVRLLDVQRPIAAGGRLQALLETADAPYVLVVDDGVYLEPDLMGRLVAAIRTTGAGFIGSHVVDLRFRDEHRPDEEAIEFWDGPVRAEELAAGGRAWERRHLHRGANLQHLRERLPRTRDRLYRVADIHGCVLYDAARLRAVGGFRGGADRRPGYTEPLSLASATQLRLLARHGGAGLFPSGAYRLAPVALSGDGAGEGEEEPEAVEPLGQVLAPASAASVRPGGADAGSRWRARRRAHGSHRVSRPRLRLPRGLVRLRGMAAALRAGAALR